MSFTTGNTNGEYKHMLAWLEQVEHKHLLQIGNGSAGNQFGLLYSSTLENVWYGTRDELRTKSNFYDDSKQQSFNIIQPYLVVYFWKRIN